MTYVENRICPTCGAEYEVYKIKVGMRDRDQEECEVCGTEIISWNGGTIYSIKLIKEKQ